MANIPDSEKAALRAAFEKLMRVAGLHNFTFDIVDLIDQGADADPTFGTPTVDNIIATAVTLPSQKGSALVNGTNYKTLAFDGQTGNFTNGQVVTGTESGATATIQAHTDAGATGTLKLTGIVEGTAAKAELDCATIGIGLMATVLEAHTAGFAGNSLTFHLIADGAPDSGAVASVVGNALTIHIEDDVTTVAEIEAAITALTGADDIIDVKTPAEGVAATQTITADDDWPAGAAFTGGLDGGTFQDNEEITDPMTGVAVVNGALSAGTFLDYDGQTGLFVAGQRVEGATSGAVATATVDVNSAAAGTLTITGATDTFDNNEVLFDPDGVAASCGTALLTAGTVTVETTAITPTSKVYLTHTGYDGGNAGVLAKVNVVDGVSFDILSNDVADTDSVDWIIVQTE